MSVQLIELKEQLRELEALVAQTKAVAELADDETMQDLSHWIDNASCALKCGLAKDPGDSLDEMEREDAEDDGIFLCLFTNENIETCECETCKDNRSEAESYRLSGGRDYETDSIYGDAN